MSEFDSGNCSVTRTKTFPVFRLFPKDGIIQTMIPLSRNNLNTGNAFVHVTEQLPESNLDHTYFPQTDVFSKSRLYLLDKIWIECICTNIYWLWWIFSSSTKWNTHQQNLGKLYGSMRLYRSCIVLKRTKVTMGCLCRSV